MVLNQVTIREQVAREQIWFFDDNVFNVADAARLGFRALWADWGYHTPDHVVHAAQLGLSRISLDEFITRPWVKSGDQPS
jgi:FMN phosphatase YigB (HAD superfamily)